MKRRASRYLLEWMGRTDRKPLLLRGARQVGKTYLVEEFARGHFSSFLAVDLEKRTDLHSLFATPNPLRIVQELALLFKTEIVPGKTLLFLDEIQACPKALASLRYFYEEVPQIHVLAAGSLIDFALRDFAYSMPVGRLEFLYLTPMSFEEFLQALGEESLVDFLSSFCLPDPLSDPLHQKLCDLLRTYFFVGGMPEAVASYVRDQDLLKVQRIQTSLLTTVENDFSKYGRRIPAEHLKTVLDYSARNIGKRVKYVQVDRDVRSAEIKKGFDLLELARVLKIVRQTSANGVPLGAEISASSFKPLFLDIGLANQRCGLGTVPLEKVMTIHEGGMAEQFVGQELLNLAEWFEETGLYFWARQEKNAQAEVDYIFPHKGIIYPVEVKAGKTGSLKSLQVFLAEKKREMGIRFNLDLPSRGAFHQTHTLLSLPLYLAGQLKRFLVTP